jgi:hypothetical protein
MSNGTLSNNAVEVAVRRYFMGDEDWEACSNRVGQIIASAENSHMIEYAMKFGDFTWRTHFKKCWKTSWFFI